jgi:molybdate transport system permease protein
VICFAVLGGVYVLLIVAMLLADVAFMAQRAPSAVLEALASPEIRYSIRLSLLSCTITTILALWTAVPLGYLLARWSFPGKAAVDVLLDIPIVLPPLVVGLSLLILFSLPPVKQFNQFVPIMYEIPGVILAQYAVSCAFAVRTMRVTFEQIPPRREQVALTLGCGRAGAFFRVVLPEARRGVLTAATLCWARSLGEFGPILVFAGATHFRTEVLPTTVFLELSVGDLYAALAVSLLMIAAAVVVLLIVRGYGMRGGPL